MTSNKKVEITIEEEFDNFASAHDATQFLRGTLFLYVDAILSNLDSSLVDKDEVRELITFMEKVFELIIKWMDLFPSKYMKYYEVFKKYKKTFLVDTNVAIAAAGAELICILDSCFRTYPRIMKMTKTFKLTEEEASTDWYINKNKPGRFKTALCYHFGRLGGFDAILRFWNADPVDTLEGDTIPLVFVNSLLESISEILKDFQNEELRENLLTEIKKIITSQVENIELNP